MRALPLLLLTLPLITGCQKLVEVHTSQGEMDLVEFREVIDAIDKDLRLAGLTDGGIVSINYEGCTYTYHPAPPTTASQLRDEISRRYHEKQATHPFVIESIRHVRAFQRGVKVKKPAKPGAL